MDAFLRQNEAWLYVNSIQDGQERLLTEIAVAKALSFLATDPGYRQTFAEAPLDLLVYARTVHEFFRRVDIVKGVLDGTITSVDDLDPFPSKGARRMTPDDLLPQLDALVDSWCERRALAPLSIILAAWPFGGGGLTDDWMRLLNALKNVRVFGALSPNDEAQIDEAVQVVEKLVNR